MTDFSKLHSSIKDVPLAKIRASDKAQRDLVQARVDFLASEFDPEMFGYPVVNLRDTHHYVIDGNHRINAAKIYIGDGWETQTVTCRVYSGMTEQQEAEMFDRLNNVLAVSAFDKFKVRVAAGRAEEVAVKKVVEKCGLHIARVHGDNAVGAVATLVKIYNRSDAATLARSLIIVNHSFGGPGMSKDILDGMARVCTRYNGALKDQDAIERLKTIRGGVGQIVTKANLLRNQTRAAIPECIAAAIVDALNSKRGGNKLPSWWKE